METRKIDIEKAKSLNKKNIKTGKDIVEIMSLLPDCYLPQRVVDDDFDSPAEFSFVWCLHKITTCFIHPQYKVSTSNGNYRIDIVLEKDGRFLGIEIDGKKWHDEEKDSIRDQFIVKETEVKSIIRVSGADANYCPIIGVEFIYKKHPLFFENLIYDNWEILHDRFISNKYSEQGVVKAKCFSTGLRNGYLVFRYDVDFLTPDNESKYFSDLECDYDDQVKKKDYSINRNTEIKTMGSHV